MKYDVFISYSRKDKDIVDKFYEVLIAEGYRVWYDIHGIYCSEQWLDKIETAIEECKVFLYFSSSNSNTKPVEPNKKWYTKIEVKYAINLNKAIFPILLDSTPFPKGTRIELDSRQHIDYTINGFEASVESIKESLKIHGISPTEDNYVADLLSSDDYANDLKSLSAIKRNKRFVWGSFVVIVVLMLALITFLELIQTNEFTRICNHGDLVVQSDIKAMKLSPEELNIKIDEAADVYRQALECETNDVEKISDIRDRIITLEYVSSIIEEYLQVSDTLEIAVADNMPLMIKKYELRQTTLWTQIAAAINEL